MRSFLIIGAAVVGGIGYAIESTILSDLIGAGMFDSKKDFYTQLFLAYLLLLLPPYVLSNPNRTETVKAVGVASGLALLDILQWLSIGALIAIGYNAFS
ncbi:membrane hypothetical protein [Vibrio jasicida]|uniref:Uncharacterized protein n=2 Tax=Vibrio jasicida TaxID=766224 RepID=A0AAU9QTS3_9VIBR|nr:membrane hypothetical protein [Vibrio jasicida]CAH1601851.1 membrane hypothetical protein [Vibrio jasicida]